MSHPLHGAGAANHETKKSLMKSSVSRDLYVESMLIKSLIRMMIYYIFDMQIYICIDFVILVF